MSLIKVCFLKRNMPPKLYAANVEDVGKPITSVKRKISKKSKPAAIPESGNPTSETPNEAKPKRIRKKANATIGEQTTITPKKTSEAPVSLDEKVEKPPRKRVKKNIQEQSNSTENLDTLLEEALSEPISAGNKEKKVKSLTPPPSVVDEETKVFLKSIKIDDDTQPPTWFKAYIQGVRAEEALIAEHKVSKKTTKAMASEEAVAKWKEPVTRERVNRSIDAHMQKMYSNIFPNRRF